MIRGGLMSLSKAVQFWRSLESNCTAVASENWRVG